MSNKTIIYNNILECAQFTTDNYWKEIFLSCACNKFPKGMKYDNIKNTLHINAKLDNSAVARSQNDIFNLPENIQERYEMLMYIFKDILKLKSQSDTDESKFKLEEVRKNNEIDLDCTWKKLKPRSLKNHILINFTIEQTKKYNIDMKSAIILYRLIQLGIQFRKISPNDIEYSKGVILSISGLKYNEKSGEFTLSQNKQKYTVYTNNKINKINRFEKFVNKWVKDYNVNPYS